MDLNRSILKGFDKKEGRLKKMYYCFLILTLIVLIIGDNYELLAIMLLALMLLSIVSPFLGI